MIKTTTVFWKNQTDSIESKKQYEYSIYKRVKLLEQA